MPALAFEVQRSFFKVKKSESENVIFIGSTNRNRNRKGSGRCLNRQGRGVTLSRLPGYVESSWPEGKH